MARVFNFSAGPATLPPAVLEQAAAEMLDWHGSGMSVMEMSHRGAAFESILDDAESGLRALLAVPPGFRILFMQGGGLAENAVVPLNLSRGGAADFVVTGAWSRKSLLEAARYCDAGLAADNQEDRRRSIPPAASWRLRDGASYVHLCSNETIDGLECHELPDLAALGCTSPLVVDCSSHLASRPIDWSRVGLAFGGAQKNVGMAGLTLVFVREDLIGHALPTCPSAFDYRLVAENRSMYNTPPTYAIYIAGLVFRWLRDFRHGTLAGLPAVEQHNIEKAQLVYDAIDGSGFYRNEVAPAFRSRMNIPFFLPDERLYAPFLAEAQARGLVQLKGHKSVGGLRASLYNAMPMEGALALVGHMREFAARHG